VSLLYCVLKKTGQKKSAKSWLKGGKKGSKKGGKKGCKKAAKIAARKVDLNLFCCCLETGLKPVLFNSKFLFNLMYLLYISHGFVEMPGVPSIT
jgi:hypothetical protein